MWAPCCKGKWLKAMFTVICLQCRVAGDILWICFDLVNSLLCEVPLFGGVCFWECQDIYICCSGGNTLLIHFKRLDIWGGLQQIFYLPIRYWEKCFPSKYMPEWINCSSHGETEANGKCSSFDHFYMFTQHLLGSYTSIFLPPGDMWQRWEALVADTARGWGCHCNRMVWDYRCN